MNKNLAQYFGKWNLFEIIYAIIGFVAIITVSLIFKTNWLVFSSSFLLFTVTILQAKGLVISQFLNLIASILYICLAYIQQFYGECLINICLIIPLSIFSIISWTKNKDGGRGNGFVRVSKITKKEWLILTIVALSISACCYVLLYYLKTNMLVLNCICVTLSLFATYLVARRSFIGFIFYLFNNILVVTLWGISTFSGNIENLPMFVCMSLFIVNNAYSVYNWHKENIEQEKVMLNRQF